MGHPALQKKFISSGSHFGSGSCRSRNGERRFVASHPLIRRRFKDGAPGASWLFGNARIRSVNYFSKNLQHFFDRKKISSQTDLDWYLEVGLRGVFRFLDLVSGECPAVRTECRGEFARSPKATADLSTPLRSAQDDNRFVVVSKSPSTRLQRVFRVGEGLAPRQAEAAVLVRDRTG